MLYRRYFSPLYLLFYSRYIDIINENNVDKFTKWQINRLFRNEDEKCISVYLHNVVDTYHQKNMEYTAIYLDRLMKIIKRCNLKLNFQEEQILFEFEECVFTNMRAMKNLDAPFKTESREKAKAKYDHSWVYLKNHNNLWVLEKSGKIFITNQAIVILKQENANNLLRFNYKSMRKINISKIGFQFDYGKSGEFNSYLIRIHSNEVLRIFMQKIFSRSRNLKRKVIQGNVN